MHACPNCRIRSIPALDFAELVDIATHPVEVGRMAYAGDGIMVAFLGNGPKAVSDRETRIIEVNADFWNSIHTSGGRFAILFHEIGHLMGADCEPCADSVSGAITRAYGMPSRDGAVAMYSCVETRDGAGEFFDAGYGES